MGKSEVDTRPTCRTFDDAGVSICENPASFIVWGHLYEKRDKGPKCGWHVPRGALDPLGFGAPAIYVIPGEVAPPKETPTSTDKPTVVDVLRRHYGSRWCPACVNSGRPWSTATHQADMLAAAGLLAPDAVIAREPEGIVIDDAPEPLPTQRVYDDPERWLEGE